MGGLEIAPGVYTISDVPGVYLKDFEAIVMADLHLGFEAEAAMAGYFIPRVQAKRVISYVEKALSSTGSGWIILAGDVKHSFSRLTRSEREELSKLFSLLREKGVRVTVVRGNHDNYLPIVARDYGVEIVEELKLGDILVVHGHKQVGDLKGARLLVMGHEHPSIRIRDKIGYLAKFPCFLYAPILGEEAHVLVLPAVGQYQTGTTVSMSPDTYLSPIIKRKVDLARAKPYILAESLGVLEFPELRLLEDVLWQAV